MTKGEALQDRMTAAIIDSAAAVLAERGGAASMEEIASAAGIGRATLYRYFRNREELLAAMAAASVRELAARIADANLDAVGFEEAIARLARGIIATGSKYVALTADGARRTDTAHPDVQATVVEPMRALFRRAAADGSVRADLPPDVLVDLFSGLVRGSLDAAAAGRGVEELAAAVTTVFLRGARPS